MTTKSRPAFSVLFYFAIAFALCAYFTFAAVQGDYGLFSRAQIEAESAALQAQLDSINAQVARMENLTKRTRIWTLIYWTNRHAAFWGTCVRMKS